MCIPCKVILTVNMDGQSKLINHLFKLDSILEPRKQKVHFENLPYGYYDRGTLN